MTAKPRTCSYCNTQYIRVSRTDSLRFCPDCAAEVSHCNRCGESKPLDQFSSRASRRNGVDHYCKSCTNDRRLYERYGIERDVYLRLLQEQGGVCAICLNPPEGDSVLHVDHCHDTLVVRGLLCSPCNTAIGLLRESVSVIGRAAEYVRLAQV